MADPPPPHVLAAFGVEDEVTPLAGGQGESFRAGPIVLKRTGDPAEGQWIGGRFSSLEGPGFRVPRPAPSRGGGWVVSGWTAFEFVEGHPAGPNGGRWPETLAACRAFHRALAGEPEPAFIRQATHAWADADRLAWGELVVEPLEPHRPAIARLERLLRPVDLPSQAIHGDFTANVLFATGSAPCVIDFSPYWRPALFAEAVVVEDAISWAGASESLAENWCREGPAAAQLLVRAVLRRVHELDQHTRRGRPHNPQWLAEYHRVIDLVERLA
jgi:uncharacterized protein (TIGR02569 family)